MTLTLQLPPQVERQLRSRASDRGLELSEYVVEALRGLAETPSANGKQESDDEGLEPTPWRGVFADEPLREDLFPNGLPLETATRPNWQPEVVIDPSRIAVESE